MSDYPTIPAPIRALMQRPPVLKGESVQKYNDLLAGLVSQVEPGDIIEWLWVLSFLDHAWDVLRIRQFKVVLIDLQHLKALSAVVMKTEPFYEYSNKGLAQETMNWWADPTNFAKKHIDPLSVPATAAVQIRESSGRSRQKVGAGRASLRHDNAAAGIPSRGVRQSGTPRRRQHSQRADCANPKP